jgi:hypothetical protein
MLFVKSRRIVFVKSRCYWKTRSRCRILLSTRKIHDFSRHAIHLHGRIKISVFSWPFAGSGGGGFGSSGSALALAVDLCHVPHSNRCCLIALREESVVLPALHAFARPRVPTQDTGTYKTGDMTITSLPVRQGSGSGQG